MLYAHFKDFQLPRFTIKKRARITGSLIASASFIALAVWGWGLSWQSLLSFFLISAVFLIFIVGAAALLGWLLSKRHKPEDEVEGQNHDEDQGARAFSECSEFDEQSAQGASGHNKEAQS